MSGALLISRALLRSWRRHPGRAFAGLAGGVLGIALATGILAVTYSVQDAIQASQVGGMVKADLIVQARSANGMDSDVAQKVQAAALPGDSVTLNYVNTRLALGGRDPLILVGAPVDFWRFLPPSYLAGLNPQDLGSGHGVWIGRQWAQAHGVARGAQLTLVGPQGNSVWTVMGLVEGTLYNHGAIAVGGLDEVNAAYGRPGMIDAIFVRRAPGQDLGVLKRHLEDVAGGAAIVGDPAIAAASYQATYASIRSILGIFALIGVLTAGAVLFLCWRLQLEDERPNVARFRLYGAGTATLALGSGLVLAAFVAVAAAVGVPLGLGLGVSLADFSKQLVQLTQLSGVPSTPLLEPALGGAAAALAILVAVWASTVFSFRRNPVIEAVSGRRGDWRQHVHPLLLVAAGLVLVVVAEIVVRVYALAAGLALLVILGSAVALALALPQLIGPPLAANAGFIRLSVGRELSANARRSGALISVFAIALMMAIALEGLTESTQAGFDASVAGWTQADLFALPGAPGKSLQDERFPAEVQQRLAKVPGVGAVGSFSWTTIEMAGKRVNLWAWDTKNVDGIIKLDIDQGVRGPDLWSALDAGSAAVTTNYARLHNLGLGDSITIPTAAGRRALKVAALVNDITYDNGIIFTSRDMFRELTRDNRLYDMLIKVQPGASATTVASAVRAALSDYPDLVVYTQAQMRAIFKQLTSSLLSAFLVFSRVLFLLALLIGAASAAASLAERAPALGLARLYGATTNMLRSQVTLESAVLGGLAWVVAFPLGLLLVDVLLQSLAAQSGILPRTVLPLTLGLASLPVAVALAIFSTWLAIRRATRGEVISVIREE